ncbi:MAG: SUMF1/EgtB/PvdO family nonheme iron enzyme [Succinivibrio sp.]
MILKKLSAFLLLSFSLVSFASDDAEKIFNPKPEKDDVTVSMPCNAVMVFRKVYTSAEKKKTNDRRFVAGTAVSSSPMAQNQRQSFIQGGFKDKNGYYYLIAKYELMQGQYEALLNQDKCPVFNKKSRLPAVRISYFDALNAARLYSIYLSSIKNPVMMQDQVAYARLPTDEEWEFASRGGVSVSQSEFESDLPKIKDNDLVNYAWYQGAESSNGKLQLAGLKDPNSLGIYDLLGNAQEMVLEPFKAVRSGRFLGLSGGICVRGGSYRMPKDSISNASRIEKPFYSKQKELSADDTSTRFVLSLLVASTTAEVKALNDEVASFGDDDETGDDALKNAGERLKKTSLENKKNLEKLEKVKDELNSKNKELLAEKTDLQGQNRKLESLNQELVSFNDSLTSANKELLRQMSELKSEIEKANTQRQDMRNVAVVANLRLGAQLCRTISAEKKALDHYEKIAAINEKNCKLVKEACNSLEKAKENVKTRQDNLEFNTKYYADTIAEASSNYTTDEFSNLLESARQSFGLDATSLSSYFDVYFRHIKEYRKLSKNKVKNFSHWIDDCNKVHK